MTLTEIKSELGRTGSQTPELDAQILLRLVSGRSQAQILAGDWRLSRRQRRRLDRLIRARPSQPLAYLTGRREFYGQTFLVDSRVLVPRPASEDLVGLAVELGRHPAVYDIGCGCGCLGLAYRLNQPGDYQLELIDNSPAALAVAELNARRLGCPVSFRLASVSDLSPADWRPGSLLLANLPYLDREKKSGHYRRCPELAAEPDAALFTGRRGLELYYQLWQRLGSGPAHLVLEADWQQHPRLIARAGLAGWRLLASRGRALAFGSSRGD